jgi:transposase
MFIRKTQRNYKGKTYTNHLLVESVHTPKGPRQRTVCSLGDLSPRPREEWLKLAHKVEEALVGQGDLFEGAGEEVQAIVAKVRAARKAGGRGEAVSRAAADSGADGVIGVIQDRVEVRDCREAGTVHVGYAFWKRLGLESILAEAGLGARTRALACAMVLNRLAAPSSEHAMPDWIRSTALGDLLGADFSSLAEDALYRTMDKVAPHREAIETALAAREGDLYNLDRTVFFYDLTSTYFEGMALGNPKAKRGYSRDKRPDCKQVVVGLAVNRDGFPLLHEVFEGNTQDRTTVERMLALFDARVGLCQGQTVVVDRGMSYPENLDTIRNHPKKLHYLVATRQSERDQFLADFEDLEGFEEVFREPSPTNPFQKKSTIRVKRKRHEGETYVLCLSAERVAKDRAIREKQEGRLLEDLGKLKARIEAGRLVKPLKIGEAMGRLKERYPRVARYYDLHYDEDEKNFAWAVNAEKRRKAEELDGSYLLRTDREDLSADEAWRTYILLTQAEDAFRDMKSPLVLRPVYHQVARRVDAHIFLSILAYHLLVAIEKTLLDHGAHTSWKTVRDALKTHQVCTVVLPTDSGDELHLRKGSTPEKPHRDIYRLLDVPEQIIEPRKTWIQSPATA